VDPEIVHVSLLLKADVSNATCKLHGWANVVLTASRAGLHHLQQRVKIGYALIGVTYLATELSILLGCRDFKQNWQIYPDPGSEFSYNYRHLIWMLTF
jgi:hypothetical protein